MTLHLHRAERADTLAAALAELLADPPADVLAQEVIAVPARGIERWLTQRLSHHLGVRDGRGDGICAAVRFPSPAALLAEVAGRQDDDPWAPDTAVWPLLEVIDGCSTEPWCRALATHLGYATGPAGDAADPAIAHRRARRYAVSRRLAGLFDGYATHRPDMLAAWASGRDEDGWAKPVPPDMAWQPELWRRLRDRIDAPDPVVRLAGVIAGLGADPGCVDLPERISLFGPTALPSRQFRVLTALAEHRDVHLWLPHPSPALWSALAASAPAGHPGTRAADPTSSAVRHPLLSSLGRDAREMQATLSAAPHTDTHHPDTRDPDTYRTAQQHHEPTLLQRLQADLRDNVRPSAGRPLLEPTDDSIQVHACHGPSRQVDVLRDVIVGMLAADPTLLPSDILVMCPDIEAYAPLIQGAFGLDEVIDGGHPAHGLWVRLADRALTQTNPLLATVQRLLDLADSRVTASEVLDLAAWGPVRRRFHFDDDELQRLSGWAVDAGARWGLDGAHRAEFGLQAYPQNTWRAALDRVLVGVAMADEDNNRLATALPLDDVGSSDVDLAGRFAELLARLTRAVDSLAGEHTVQGWLTALVDSVDSLTSVSATNSWQSAELRRELGDVQRKAELAGASAVSLGRADIRALLAGRLGGRPTRANFRTGTLTVCTMVPMRSVPHRVVCLLGLDDGVFPRTAREDGDNVLAREPAVGERDPRSEDRQLMLDAVLAATDKLVITFTGADERTGMRKPPAVPVGELLDTLDETATAVPKSDKPRTVRDQVEIRHPLQPFDARTVLPGKLGRPGAFTFDPTALAGARAAAGPRVDVPLFLPSPLPAPPRTDIDLADLIRLLTHPAKGFLRQRLDIGLRFEEDDPSDALPVELDALETWGVGDRLLKDRLAGVSEEECRQAEWRRGVLPPGPLGQRTLNGVLEDLRPLVDRTAALRAAPRRTADVTVDLADGRQVRGTVSGLHDTVLVAVLFSRLGAAARLRAWISIVALTASDGDSSWGAATVGRGAHAHPQCATLTPLPPGMAGAVIEELVELYDQGLREPLPLPVKAAAAYAETRFGGADPADAYVRAREKWATGKFPGEDDDDAHALVWGRRAPFASLLTPCRTTDLGAMAAAIRPAAGGESDRFAALATKLWFPLLDHEQKAML
ncbi:exodeoxyribonuclease V subunit gamma [Nakamurella sp. GG22]